MQIPSRSHAYVADANHNYAAYIRAHPGTTQADIARAFTVNRSTVLRRITTLTESSNCLWCSQEGRLYMLNNLTVPDLMVRGMAIPELDKPALVDCPPGAHCCITGEPIERGYVAQKIVPSAAGEFLELMGGDVMGYMSEMAARAFKGSWNLGSRFIFEDATHYHPLLNAKSAAKQDRACWSQLVRDVWPDKRGMRYVAILATDYKKKIWPRAVVGTLGEQAPILVFDASRNLLQNVTVDWRRLVEALDFVESVYTAGFVKPAIESNLLSSNKAVAENGLYQSIDWENHLKTLRGTPEFTVAAIIAQKGA